MESRILSYVLGVVRDIGVEVSDPPPADVVLGPDGLGLESLSLVELIVGVEHEFGISLPENHPATLPTATLEQFVAAVAEQAMSAAG